MDDEYLGANGKLARLSSSLLLCSPFHYTLWRSKILIVFPVCVLWFKEDDWRTILIYQE